MIFGRTDATFTMHVTVQVIFASPQQSGNSWPAILGFDVEYGTGSRVLQILFPAKGG
jgi:hypothetical protein